MVCDPGRELAAKDFTQHLPVTGPIRECRANSRHRRRVQRQRVAVRHFVRMKMKRWIEPVAEIHQVANGDLVAARVAKPFGDC